MAPLDTESQFKFLVSCIKHSTAGKVDFVNVANELGIVSKAAAAKRYERLLKAHGVPTGGGNRANTPAAGSAGPAGALKAGPKRGAAAAKKRKTAPSPDTDDEEDVKLNLNSEAEKDTKKGVKKAAKKVTKTKKEKAEVAGDDDDDDSSV